MQEIKADVMGARSPNVASCAIFQACHGRTRRAATFAICSAAAVLFLFFDLRLRNDPATHGKGRVGKLNAYTLRYTITRYIS